MNKKDWRVKEVERLGRRQAGRLLGWLEGRMGGAVHHVVRQGILNSYAMMVQDVTDNVLRVDKAGRKKIE